MRFLMFSLFVLVVILCTFQIVCVVTAFTGDVSNRINLMGVFAILPWVFVTATCTLACFLVRRPQTRFEKVIAAFSGASIVFECMLFF
jgi:hypothetical protein